MFKRSEVNRDAGKGYTVLDAGTYPARVEEAKQVSSNWGSEQLEVSFKVKYHGRYVHFRQWLEYESETGESTPKVEAHRRVIVELAEACNAVDEKTDEPVPGRMAGNLVTLVVSRFTTKKGKEVNGIEEVRVPGEGKEAPASAPQDPSPARSRYDGQDARPGGGGSTGDGFDDDIPFIRMDGLPW